MQMPVIDTHQHFWAVARGDYGWLTEDLGPIYRDFGPADLRPLMEAAGIEATVLVQAAPTVAETEYLLSIAADTEFVQAVVGWVDFEAADAPDTIARLAADPNLKGVRPMIQDIADPNWMLRPELAPAFAALQRHGLRFDALLTPHQLPPFLKFLERYPDLAIVIDHGAKPPIRDAALEPWAGLMAEAATETRVHCKMSGLVTEAARDWSDDDLKPYLDHLFECFGSARLMWGSDWPVVNLAGGHARWWQASSDYLAQFSAEDRAEVLSGTAARFYGLD